MKTAALLILLSLPITGCAHASKSNFAKFTLIGYFMNPNDPELVTSGKGFYHDNDH